MDKRKNINAFISILTCSTLLLFVLSQVSARALTSFNNSHEETYTSNTSIGKVNISFLQQDQAEEKVNERIHKWKMKKNIRFTFLNNEQEVSEGVFQFLVPESFQKVKNGKENPLSIDINNSELHNKLRKLGMESIIDEVNLKNVKKVLQQYAENLSESKLDINMEEFLIGFNHKKASTLSSEIILINNQRFMDNWLKKNNSFVINPNSYFSLSSKMKKNINDLDSVSEISSSIYKAALQTNLQILDRNISETLPPGIELGSEAYINDSNMDLKLYNPNNYEITIKSKKIAFNRIELTIVGPTNPLKYVITKENEKIYPQRTIIEYEQDQNVKRMEKGQSGYSIEVYKEIYLKNILLERQLVSNDFYLPQDNVEYKSLPSGGSEIGNNTTDSNNMNGDKGDTSTGINDQNTIQNKAQDSSSLNEKGNNSHDN